MRKLEKGPSCGCCTGEETYKRRDGGHDSRSIREAKALKEEFAVEDLEIFLNGGDSGE